MFDLSSVNTTNEATAKGAAVIPAGNYSVMCTDAEIGTTKSGTGKFIKAVFTVKAGALRGTKLTEYFNVQNDNAQAVRIGWESLAKFLKASGYTGDYKFESFEDAAIELQGRICSVETKIEPGKGEYGPRAAIKKWLSATTATMNGNATAATTSGAATPPTAPASAPADDIGF